MLAWRLILCDLDGTLLDDARGVHAENMRALQEAMARGIKVGFATGRPPLSVAPYVAAVKPNAPLIHMNGALVRDFSTGAEIFKRTLPLDVAVQTVQAARTAGFHTNVYVGTEIWIDVPSDVSRASEQKDGVPHTVKGDVAAVLRHHQAAPVKIMCIGPAEQIPALSAALHELAGPHVNLVNSEHTYLEVLPAGCNKLEGARALCAHLGVDLSEVVAFGDNKNDLELLLGVGCGVAMGNSHADVLRQVKTQIGHHNTSAIGGFLQQLLR